MAGGVRVSIGIPFLNARHSIADAVRSVFAQTYPDWELLLVDDGSTDGSVDVVRRIDDPRVRVLSDGTNRGLCARLNEISSLATGRYLARMDADDLMHPERIERQVRFLTENPEVEVVDTTTWTVNEHLAPQGIRGERPLDPRPDEVLRYGLLIHPTVMGHADWFRRNPYDAEYVRAEDRELWTRTVSTTRFSRLCEPLFFYREGQPGRLWSYLRSEQTVRAILRHYGPSLIGAGGTRRLLVRSCLKSVSWVIATGLGLHGRLVRNRNRPLEAAEIRTAQRALAEIRATPVPGLSDVPVDVLV